MMTGKAEFKEYRPDLKDIALSLFDSNVPRFFAPHEVGAYSEFLDQSALGMYWLMFLDGEPVGCGGIAQEAPTLFSLCYGIIHGRCHRQGLGKALIQFRLKKILELPGVEKIRLDTMQINPGFFEKFGFETESHERDFYAPGIDKIEMSLNIRTDKQRADLIHSL